MRRLTACVFALGVIAVGSSGHAQGVQTGTVTGTVVSADDLTLPGVTVTVASPSLQGTRSGVTDVNGVYVIKLLPAGLYTVSFEISNFQPARRQGVALNVGGTTTVDTTMALGSVTERVTIVAQAPTLLSTVTSGQVFKKADLDLLPVGRRPADITELAPGLTNDTPNAGQVTIAGATAFDNVFMLNGVDINDNLFGTANNLFIEDAIQETSVLTGGISAEYGRFSGGVVNMITKSGGNTFSGSFRENFSNPKWIRETPRQVTAGIVNQDILSKTSEVTVGGPVVKDRLWFFGAGRYENSSTPITFVLSSVGDTRKDTNKRGEMKGTATLASGHVVSADYTNNSTNQANRYSLNSNSLDPSTLITEQQPNNLIVANYSGIVARKYLSTVQFSQKKFGFRNAGGTDSAITASPIRTRGITSGISANLLYAAPFFSALDPENRNNRQFTGSVSRTVSAKRLGTHDLKAGGEFYRSERTGGNSQSATGYVFQSDYLQGPDGKPVYDSKGVPIPVWTPGVSRVQNWLATVGAQLNINTTSLFVQDRWVASRRLTLELGTRFEMVRSNATGDIVTVDTSSIVPRLGVSFDVEGNSRTVLQATYGHYSGKYSEAQFGSNTDVGNPSRVTYGYTGPAGQGRDFAAAYNPANYATVISGSFPTANIFVADGINSPIVKELTLGLGRTLGQRGSIKATYQLRRWSGFVEDYIQLSNGTVNVNRLGANIGQLTKVVYDNTNGIDRDYQAFLLQASYRPSASISAGGHYTMQIKNNGNANAEAANQPGIPSALNDYPEIIGPALDRYLPEGRLADYQRHKLRMYGTYTQRFGRFGSVDVSPIWRVNSGQVFSYIAASVPLSAIELARNPGYPTNDINSSTAYNLFFGDRGRGDFKGYGLLDLSLGYHVPIWKALQPWIKAEVYNVANNQKQVAWDTTVTADANSVKDANGLATGFIQGANFSKPTADNQYPQPVPGTNGGRLFRMAMGIRF